MTATPDFSLVPDPAALDRYAAELSEKGHVRIDPAFRPEVAQALYNHLDRELIWQRAVNQGETTWDLGPESIAVLKGERLAAFLEPVHAAARDGFQFLFDSVRVSDDPAERSGRGLLLDRVVDAFNAPAQLDGFTRLTGRPIRKVDGQATRYLAGHFLTEHDDAVDGKNRVAAYVISLSPRWRAIWGGLLQFHDARGDIAGALAPVFNAIHLFTVPRLHSVSIVAPFAGAPRYSITGWLRSG